MVGIFVWLGVLGRDVWLRVIEPSQLPIIYLSLNYFLLTSATIFILIGLNLAKLVFWGSWGCYGGGWLGVLEPYQSPHTPNLSFTTYY